MNYEQTIKQIGKQMEEWQNKASEMQVNEKQAMSKQNEEPTDQKTLQPTNKPINQSMYQSMYQSINQSIGYGLTSWL